MMTIKMMDAAKIVEGKHSKYTLIEIIETGVEEGSCSYYFSAEVVFTHDETNQVLMVELCLPFPIDKNSEGWEDIGYGSAWFDEYDNEDEPLEVFEMELKTIQKWVKK